MGGPWSPPSSRNSQPSGRSTREADRAMRRTTSRPSGPPSSASSRLVALNVARKQGDGGGRHVRCHGCHQAEAAVAERAGQVGLNHAHVVRPGAEDSPSIDVGGHHGRLGRRRHQMVGDGTRARAQVQGRTAGAVEHIARPPSELLGLRPRNVDVPIDPDLTTAETLGTRDPGQWLAVFAPEDPRLERGLVVGAGQQFRRLPRRRPRIRLSTVGPTPTIGPDHLGSSSPWTTPGMGSVGMWSILPR